MHGENYPYTNISATIADAIWNTTSNVMGHSSLLGLTYLFGNKTSQDKKTFFRNWLGSFVSLEAGAPIAQNYTSAAKERLRPIVTGFLTPIIEQQITPVINDLANKSLIEIVPETVAEVAEVAAPVATTWWDTMTNYFYANSSSIISNATNVTNATNVNIPNAMNITCAFACDTFGTCMEQLGTCRDQVLTTLEHVAPQGGEALAHLLDTLLSSMNTGIDMPYNVLQAIAGETGLPYYAVYSIAAALAGAAGYGAYCAFGGGGNNNNTNTNNNNNANSSAASITKHKTVNGATEEQLDKIADKIADKVAEGVTKGLAAAKPQ